MEKRRRRIWDLFGFDELPEFDEMFQRMLENLREAVESGEFGEKSFIMPFEGPNYKGFIKYEYSHRPLNEQEGESEVPLFFDELPPEPFGASEPNSRRARSEKPLVVTFPETGKDTLVDIIDNPQELLVVMEVPASSKDDIKLNLTERKLEVRTDSPVMFYKVIQLPCEVDCDSAKANFRNRILEIRLRKK
ncbi:MAG: Hsp20/alpha crystallin family protein [Candidatus Freyarchaeota archaeon]|nr:Hsp20/alpha crystallin family protein [Candidatus Jordarchaeia archaeon]MBS7280301.1 Hsp20/alpha crystallin family protein [Candidatus Jordarchaeia archaeon]